MWLPKKLRAPSATGETRNDVLENSALMIDSPSETIVPLPTRGQERRVVVQLGAEVGAGLARPGSRSVAEARR